MDTGSMRLVDINAFLWREKMMSTGMQIDTKTLHFGDDEITKYIRDLVPSVNQRHRNQLRGNGWPCQYGEGGKGCNSGARWVQGLGYLSAGEKRRI